MLLRVSVIGFPPRERTVDIQLYNCDYDKNNNNITSTLVDVSIGQENKVKRRLVLLYCYYYIMHVRPYYYIIIVIISKNTRDIILLDFETFDDVLYNIL